MNSLDSVNTMDAGIPMAEFKPYVASLGDTYKAGAGRRLVKLQFKAAVSGKNAGKAAAANSYIAVPDHITPESVAHNLDSLMPAFIGYLQDAENTMLRADHVAGIKRMSDSSFSMGKLVGYLESTGAGRLNKEQLEAWFEHDVASRLKAAFITKLGMSETPTEAEESKLAMLGEAYKQKFAALASPKTSYMPEEANILITALSAADAGLHGIGARLLPRLEKMKAATPDAMLLSL